LDPGECGATTVDSGGGRFDDEEGRWRSPSLRGTARHLKRQTEDGGGVLLWAARGGGGGAQDQRSAARRSTMASSRPAIGAGGGRRPRRRERWSCGGAWRPGARRRGLDDGGGGSPEATAATAQAPRRRGEPPPAQAPFPPFSSDHSRGRVVVGAGADGRRWRSSRMPLDLASRGRGDGSIVFCVRRGRPVSVTAHWSV
jgi:hypothetical protein